LQGVYAVIRCVAKLPSPRGQNRLPNRGGKRPELPEKGPSKAFQPALNAVFLKKWATSIRRLRPPAKPFPRSDVSGDENADNHEKTVQHIAFFRFIICYLAMYA
jgi:hypothetical protein